MCVVIHLPWQWRQQRPRSLVKYRLHPPYDCAALMQHRLKLAHLLLMPPGSRLPARSRQHTFPTVHGTAPVLVYLLSRLSSPSPSPSSPPSSSFRHLFHLWTRRARRRATSRCKMPRDAHSQSAPFPPASPTSPSVRISRQLFFFLTSVDVLLYATLNNVSKMHDFGARRKRPRRFTSAFRDKIFLSIVSGKLGKAPCSRLFLHFFFLCRPRIRSWPRLLFDCRLVEK